MEWQEVAREAELEEGRPVAAQVGDQEVLLVRLGGRICAYGHKCTHYGAPLSEGVVLAGAAGGPGAAGAMLVCPWHNARFEAATGRLLAGPALDDLPAWEAEVGAGGAVLVRAGGPSPGSRPEIPPPAGEDRRTFLILGGGAAGNAAAEMLRRQGFAGRLLVVTPEADLPYDRTMLSKDYLAGTAKRSWLPLRKKAFYERLRIEFLTGRTVRALDPARRRVTLDDGQALAGERILLATGGRPRTLAIPGMDLPGVFLLRSLADCNRLIGAIPAGGAQGGRVVVAGTGFIGLEAAAALRERGLEVHVAGPAAVPLARVFGEEVGGRLLRLHEERGVRFHLGARPARVLGSGRVEGVELEGGERLPADLLLVGVGIEPVLDYLAGTGLAEGDGVPVDARLQTRAEGIFAAGDIALVPSPPAADGGEAPLRVEHWTVAERHGQHAARAMLGAAGPYEEVPFFWTRHYDTSVKYAGWGGAFDRVAVREGAEGGGFLAGYYRDGRLRGVAAAGFARPFIRVQALLNRGLTLEPQLLADPAFDLTES